MKKLPVALQLYTVREEMQTDFEGTLKKIKMMGYDGVEFAGLYGRSAADVKAMTGSIGLVPISAHVPIADMLAEPDSVMKTYSQIGCKFIAIPWMDEKRRPGGEDYASTVEDIKGLIECAKKHGLALMYHNHNFEFVKVSGQYALDILYENIPELMAELDTCWIDVAGEDPAQYIEKYAGRAPIVHLKDYFRSGTNPTKMYELIGKSSKDTTNQGVFEFRPVGHGVQDFVKIMDAISRAGTQWCVIEQDKPSMGRTPLECAELSIEYMKSL